MKGIIIIIGSFLFGSIGWWLGSLIGLTSAAILSGIAGGVGIWAARRFMQEFLD